MESPRPEPIRSSQLLAVVVAGCWVLGPGLHGQATPGIPPAPHFWDEIPASPSTTMPGNIKDGYWHGQYQRVNREVTKANQAEIVFFGDSITWHWSLGAGTGREVWEQEYERHHPINMGNSGDITPVMLYRVTRGNLDFGDGQGPKVAVLLCGTNNFVVNQSAGGEVRWDLGADCPPEDVASGVRAIAQVFRRRLPRTRVIMMGILPVSNEAKWAKCRQVNAINAATVCDPNEVAFIDVSDRFLRPDGSIDPQLFTDGTHLTAEGYRVWARSIRPLVSAMMKADPLDPVKIMMIGDAITEGPDSTRSYRRYLDGMLRREGHLIDFVGSRRRHHDDKVEPDNYEYDPDHEAHWGKDSSWLARNMPGLLAGTSPDIAVIHLGTKDIVSGNPAAGALTDDICDDVRDVITALRVSNPDVRIVLARITPVRDKANEVALLNRKLVRLVGSQSTTRSPVVAADLASGFHPADDLAGDGILPTANGARKMASAFFEIIDKMIRDMDH